MLVRQIGVAWRQHLMPVLLLCVASAGLSVQRQQPAAGPTAIALENQRPGHPGWISAEIRQAAAAEADDADHGDRARPSPDPSGSAALSPSLASAASGSISGYASRQSVNTGEPISLHVRSAVSRYDVVVYRLGWYGGDGARVVTTVTGLTGINHPIPQPDAFGMVAANWPAAPTLSTQGWLSGYYVAAFVPSGTTVAAGHAVFVVRNDASTAAVLVQIPFLTYQAYNNWGGRSTYDANSTGSRAYKVSFDRPYAARGGTGDLFNGDYQMIRWLEREGYDVTYTTNADTHRQPGLMNGHRVFVTGYHDEYWTSELRGNLLDWIGSGRSAAFLGANSIYWQVRLEPSSSGVQDRVMVAYKNTTDPMYRSATPGLTTITFGGLGKSEEAILGSRYEWYGVTADWVVTNAQHWIYAGTGLTNGSRLSSLVGYEWDRAFAGKPADGTLLSASPMGGSGWQQNAVLRETSSGALVFNAGTNNFPRYLAGDGESGGDARVERMTANLLSRAGAAPGGSPSTTTTSTTSMSTTSTTSTMSTTTTTPPLVWVPERVAVGQAITVTRSAPRGTVAPAVPTGTSGRGAVPGN